MKPVQTLRKAFDRISASGEEAARPKVRRAPACEILEGRQLLNAAWTPPQGFAGWDGAAGKGADASVHVSTLDAKGAHGAGSTSKLTGAPGGAGNTSAFPGAPGGAGNTSAFPGAPGGAGNTSAFPGAPGGVAGKTLNAPSAQLQTDFKTLHTDEKALQAEIPSNLTAAVKADQTVIQQAFSSLTQTQLQALRPSGPPSGTTSSNPTANMTATLTTAGVSSSQITAIETDFKNLQTAISTTDPSLQTKIAADKAAIVQDGGPALSVKGTGMPGMF